MPSAQFALSTASAARSKDDAELGHNTPKAAARISVSGLGCDRGSLTGVGVNTSNHEAGQRSSTGKGSDGVQSGLQNESDHSDDTEDMGFGCDECAIYAGTVSTLRNLLARARKQTERVRASSRSETTKALERKNEELQKELASERVRVSLRSESTKAIERRNEVLEKELASTKATLSRTEQKAAAAAAERDEALSRKIGGQTAMPAQSLERRHDDPKRGNKTRTLNAASTATTAAAAPAAPTAKKRVAPWTSRVRVPSEVSDAREPVALEHASTALEAAPRETAAISGRELNYGDLVPHESFLDDIWPASVEIPYPNLTVVIILTTISCCFQFISVPSDHF